MGDLQLGIWGTNTITKMGMQNVLESAVQLIQPWFGLGYWPCVAVHYKMGGQLMGYGLTTAGTWDLRCVARLDPFIYNQCW